MDCLFCKIAKHEIESKKIYEDDDFFVFLEGDAFPKPLLNLATILFARFPTTPNTPLRITSH